MEKRPKTAKEIIKSLEWRFIQDEDYNYEAVFHFNISGPDGGQFTATIQNNRCTVTEGMLGKADCTITAKDKEYEDVELGRTNPMIALMSRKIIVSNMAEILKFKSMFKGVLSKNFDFNR